VENLNQVSTKPAAGHTYTTGGEATHGLTALSASRRCPIASNHPEVVPK